MTEINETDVSGKIDTKAQGKFLRITEGLATMNYDQSESVFYNKVQVFNRDMSIQTIKLFAETLTKERQDKYNEKMVKYNKNPTAFPRAPYQIEDGITVLDALAATGLRSVRYLKEIPGVRHVTINDLSGAAVLKARDNCHENGVEDTRYSIHEGDAVLFMHESIAASRKFDVIDLDPYGSAAPFLDSAVSAVSDGGLLCITCTDMPVLTGGYSDVCYSKYGSFPLRGRYLHEMSLRILLHSIDAAANKHKRHIVPWMSLSVDFYVRVFVRVYDSAAMVKQAALNRVMVYQSGACSSFFVQPLARPKVAGHDTGLTAAVVSAPAVCPETGRTMKIGGPFWGAPIHQQWVVDELLKRVNRAPGNDPSFATGKRMLGVLTAISEELKDVPFYYSLTALSHELGCIMPITSHAFSALVNAGYRVSQFHHEPLAIKTDAPDHVVWDMMRAHCKIHPSNIEGAKTKKMSKHMHKVKQYLQQSHSTSTTGVEADTNDADSEAATTSSAQITDTAAGEDNDALVVTEHIKIRQAILSKPSVTSIDFSFNRKWNLGSKNKSILDPSSSSSSSYSHLTSSATNTSAPLHQSLSSESAHRAAKKVKRVARFLPNPEPNWGPKRRAGAGAVISAENTEVDEDSDVVADQIKTSSDMNVDDQILESSTR